MKKKLTTLLFFLFFAIAIEGAVKEKNPTLVVAKKSEKSEKDQPKKAKSVQKKANKGKEKKLWYNKDMKILLIFGLPTVMSFLVFMIVSEVLGMHEMIQNLELQALESCYTQSNQNQESYTYVRKCIVYAYPCHCQVEKKFNEKIANRHKRFSISELAQWRAKRQAEIQTILSVFQKKKVPSFRKETYYLLSSLLPWGLTYFRNRTKKFYQNEIRMLDEKLAQVKEERLEALGLFFSRDVADLILYYE